MLSIVIVTYNSEDVIQTCISSIGTHLRPNIVIVDNASTDSTTSLVEKKFKEIQIRKLQNNLGYAGGNNVGIELALKKRAEYLLILNPDTVLHKDCIKKFLFHAGTHVQTQILGPKIYKVKNHVILERSDRISNKKDPIGRERSLQDDEKILWSVGGVLDKKRYTAKLVGYDENDRGQYDTSQQVDFISGTCMLIPRKILEIGMRFEEKYFLYYEDVEFCMRAKKHGFNSVVVPDAKIDHLEVSESDSGQAKMSNIKNYYLARNHLLFVERNASIGVQLREIARIPKSSIEHVVSGDRFAGLGLRDYFLRRFGKNS